MTLPYQKINSTSRIHPTVTIDGEVEIGAHNLIGPYCHLRGPLVIGDRNHISGHVMIGMNAEHLTKSSTGKVIIGNRNEIREHTVIQRGTGEHETEIQNNCFIMAYSYIAHDCLLESEVILSARSSLAGHCRILKGASLGLGALLAPFTTIGSYAFVGMGSIVLKSVQPFSLVVGNPAHFLRFNLQHHEELSLTEKDLKKKIGNLTSKNKLVLECIEHFQNNLRDSSKMLLLTK